LGCTVVALSLLALTACSPAVGGHSGIRMGASGLVAVLRLCADFGDLGSVRLYRVTSPGKVGEEMVALERVGARPKTRVLTVDLADPGDGWRVTAGRTPPAIDPAEEYELRAWNVKRDTRVYSFPFRPTELPADGAILVKTYRDGAYAAATMTDEEFAAFADRRCR
jgi:hypothetical protein